MAVWYDMRIEWSSSDPVYIGKAAEPDKPTGDLGWHIKKLTWTGGDIVRIQKAVGAWDQRKTMTWGA